MVCEREDFKGFNTFRTPKFPNRKRRRDLAKNVSVVVEKAALKTEICRPVGRCYLLAGIVSKATWLGSIKKRSEYYRFRLKESPKQVVRDLAVLEKWGETILRRCVGTLHEPQQQVEMLQIRSVLIASFS